MQTVNASTAKQNFGELLDKAQRENIVISKHGRPVAVMISAHDYELEQEQKRSFLEQRLALAAQEVKDGQLIDGPEFMESLRAKYK